MKRQIVIGVIVAVVAVVALFYLITSVVSWNG